MIGHIKLPLSNDVNSGYGSNEYYNNDWGIDWGIVNRNSNSRITLVVSNELSNSFDFILAGLPGKEIKIYSFDNTTEIITCSAQQFYTVNSINLDLLHHSGIINDIKYYILTIVPDSDNKIELFQVVNKKLNCDLTYDTSSGLINDDFNSSSVVVYAHFLNINVNILYKCFRNSFRLRYVGFFGNCSITNLNNTFENCSMLEYVKLPDYTSTLTYLNSTFKNCYSLVGVKMPNIVSNNITTFNQMFYNCYSLYEFDWGNLSNIIGTVGTVDVSGISEDMCSIIDYSFMFCNCMSLKIVNLPTLRYESISNTVNYGLMFKNCNSLVSLVNDHDSCLVLKYNPVVSDMFLNCTSLVKICINLIDTIGFNTDTMFDSCISLRELIILPFYATQTQRNVVVNLNNISSLCRIYISNAFKLNYLSISNSLIMSIDFNECLQITGNFTGTTVGEVKVTFNNCTFITENFVNYILDNLPIVSVNKTIEFVNSGPMPPIDTTTRNVYKTQAQTNGWITNGC